MLVVQVEVTILILLPEAMVDKHLLGHLSTPEAAEVEEVLVSLVATDLEQIQVPVVAVAHQATRSTGVEAVVEQVVLELASMMEVVDLVEAVAYMVARAEFRTRQQLLQD